MTDDLYVSAQLSIPAAELSEVASRSSGPGGQHVNKTSTRISLRWHVVDSPSLSDEQRQLLLSRLRSRLSGTGELLVHCAETRSQAKNREGARQRMAELIADALIVPKRRKKRGIPQGLKEKRLQEKSARSNTKKQRSKNSWDT